MNDGQLVFAVIDTASWAVLIGVGISFAASRFVRSPKTERACLKLVFATMLTASQRWRELDAIH
jgi:hypothetical protein